MEAGRRVPAGDPIPGYFPAAVTAAEWQAIQGRPSGRTDGQIGAKVSNLFAGLIFDGETGAKLVYVDKRKAKGGPGEYMVTASVPKPTRKITYPYRTLEITLLGCLLADLTAPAIMPPEAPQASPHAVAVAALELKIGTISGQISRLTSAIESGTAPAAIVQRIAALEEAKAPLDAQLAQARRRKAAAEHGAKATAENWDEFQRLLAGAIDPANVPVRLRLREELRRRVARILLNPVAKAPQKAPWKRHVILRVDFRNGASRVIEIQHRERGKEPWVTAVPWPPASPESSPEPEAKMKPKTPHPKQ